MKRLSRPSQTAKGIPAHKKLLLQVVTWSSQINLKQCKILIFSFKFLKWNSTKSIYLFLHPLLYILIAALANCCCSSSFLHSWSVNASSLTWLPKANIIYLFLHILTIQQSFTTLQVASNKYFWWLHAAEHREFFPVCTPWLWPPCISSPCSGTQ